VFLFAFFGCSPIAAFSDDEDRADRFSSELDADHRAFVGEVLTARANLLTFSGKMDAVYGRSGWGSVRQWLENAPAFRDRLLVLRDKGHSGMRRDALEKIAFAIGNWDRTIEIGATESRSGERKLFPGPSGRVFDPFGSGTLSPAKYVGEHIAALNAVLGYYRAGNEKPADIRALMGRGLARTDVRIAELEAVYGTIDGDTPNPVPEGGCFANAVASILDAYRPAAEQYFAHARITSERSTAETRLKAMVPSEVNEDARTQLIAQIRRLDGEAFDVWRDAESLEQKVDDRIAEMLQPCHDRLARAIRYELFTEVPVDCVRQLVYQCTFQRPEFVNISHSQPVANIFSAKRVTENLTAREAAEDISELETSWFAAWNVLVESFLSFGIGGDRSDSNNAGNSRSSSSTTAESSASMGAGFKRSDFSKQAVEQKIEYLVQEGTLLDFYRIDVAANVSYQGRWRVKRRTEFIGDNCPVPMPDLAQYRPRTSFTDVLGPSTTVQFVRTPIIVQKSFPVMGDKPPGPERAREDAIKVFSQWVTTGDLDRRGAPEPKGGLPPLIMPGNATLAPGEDCP